MSKKYEQVRKAVEDGKYKILDDDDERITIRYQMNTIYICPSKEDDGFVAVLLTDFADVTDDNLSEVMMKCHRLNREMKFAKLYIAKDVIVASAEFYYIGRRDLAHQIKMALNCLVAAKVNYRRLE